MATFSLNHKQACLFALEATLTPWNGAGSIPQNAAATHAAITRVKEAYNTSRTVVGIYSLGSPQYVVAAINWLKSQGVPYHMLFFREGYAGQPPFDILEGFYSPGLDARFSEITAFDGRAHVVQAWGAFPKVFALQMCDGVPQAA